jgi:lipopolysaccharide/colanic/teichoic acid biosynthesis glycosyltransferase
MLEATGIRGGQISGTAAATISARVRDSRARVLVVGEELEATRPPSFPRKLIRAEHLVGVLSSDGRGGVRLRGEAGVQVYESIEKVLNDHAIDEVVQLGPCAGIESSTLFYTCAIRGITLRTLVRSPLGEIGRYSIKRLAIGEYLLSLETVPPLGITLALKRAIDILGALFGLIFCILAYARYGRAIKRETEGSVLFTQVRVGRNGRLFKLFKFRTMHVSAEQRQAELAAHNQMKGPIFKMREDPRVTPLGRYLRRRYIDELPQFWNVLRGEMSLVGTRPPTPDEVARYRPHHQRRLSMKPGITGLWQLRGNGQVSNFEEIVALDCRYIDNWSLWEDSKIIFGTILQMLRGSGW